MIFDPRASELGKGDWRTAGEASGPITVTPDPAVVDMAAVDPAVVVGGPVTVTPDLAIFVLTAVDPTVIVGGPITITPDPAIFDLTATDPTVIGGGKRGGLIPAMIGAGL